MPDIFPGNKGRLLPPGVIVSDEFPLDPQELSAKTCITPALLPIIALMELVVEEPLYPEGSNHEYEVVPVTLVIVYVCVIPEHGEILPVIAPGDEGKGVTATAKTETLLLEQALLATTLILPLVAPATTLIRFDVEIPVHPAGSVHVYEVDPVTNGTEYVCDDDWQTVVFPDIVPGADNAEIVNTELL